jgi:hypothetical protein
MAKASFSVVAIRPGRGLDYSKYNRGMSVNDSGEALHCDLLSLSVTVEANNKSDAEMKVQKLHPDHSIDSSATERLG